MEQPSLTDLLRDWAGSGRGRCQLAVGVEDAAPPLIGRVQP